ncbi:bifunctional riboflavin kinase/FAD synthetase [Candidatus Curculioniphilus buchneri]|uniref:bifunctional riboflavin kinase/FAD synthetase n=1 Tax=Candidatus Curculioniphilus buchneri TaxID=690594 RepID=UPI00376F450F
MEFIRGIYNLQPHHHGCILTIGNFDGFHRGHQAIIAELRAQSYSRGLQIIVVLFEPQPQEYFFGKDAPARLTRLRDKIKYLETAGVDVVLCIAFNKKFASINAHTFVYDLLIKKLGVHFIGIGDDFRFGARRQGDFDMLFNMGQQAGFEVIKTITYTEGGRRISSTAVREALKNDRLLEAEMLLGHPYRISGRVIYGDAVGRTIGFPTANISFQGRKTPINGVYAVEVYGISDRPFPGVMNIGTRPTVSGLCQRLDVHLLNMVINLYGRHIEVVICKKIRNEQQFASLDALKYQIINDVQNVNNYFKLTTIHQHSY